MDEDDHESESRHEWYPTWDLPESPPEQPEAEPLEPGRASPELELSDLGRPDGEQLGAPPTTQPASDDPLTTTFAVSDASSEVVRTRQRRPGFGRGRWLVIVVAALFVVGGAGVGLKLFALRGSGDVLEQMVPADADIFATAYLDPSLSQKLHLRQILEKFPALGGSSGLNGKVDRLLAQFLHGTGLDFDRDVKPWLGTQMAAVVQVQEQGPRFAVLIASKDDPSAQAALAKLRTGPASDGFDWTDSTHDGVRVSVGTAAGQESVAYAYLDHTAILANDRGMLERIIDTDRGRVATLSSTAEYSKALSGLPADRLALVYVNAGALVDRFTSTFAEDAGLSPDVFDTTFKGLKAYRSVGMTLSAESNGIAAQVSVNIDSSKLTADQRRALSAPSHPNTVLEWAPEDAFAMIATTGFDGTLRDYVSQAEKADPGARASLDRLGLTGSKGLIAHLTGDAGLVAGPSTSGKIPMVAALVGTDDPASANRFLDKLRGMVSQGLAQGTGDAGGSWQQESYQAAPFGKVTINWLSQPDLASLGVEPAYATVKGMTIIASSRDAVKAALDAHGAKGRIGDSATFRDALQGAGQDAGTVEYFDVQGIAGAIRDALPPEGRREFERRVDPNLKPVKAFVITMTTTADAGTLRLFVLVR